MKKLQLIVAVMLVSISPKTVDAAILYTDIPDATLTAGGTIDINFDGAGAAEFTFTDMGFSGIEPAIIFTSNTQHFCTVSTGEWDVIKGLAVNTTINGTTGWFDAGDAYIDPGWGTTPFPTGADTYIGAQFNLGANTYYGWIRVNWNGNGTFIVKDFAYNTIPQTAILAGAASSAGLSDNEITHLIVSPNPATTFISVELVQELTMLTLIDVAGETIKTYTLPTTELRIDLQDLQAGMYFLIATPPVGSPSSTKICKQ